MKFSCLPVSYFEKISSGEMTIKDWAREGRDVGLDAIDLSISFIKDRSPRTLDLLRKEVEGEGIRVAMLTTSPDFTNPEKEQRKAEILRNREDISIASQLGAEIVRVTAGQNHPGLLPRDGLNWAVEGLMTAIAIAKQEHVTLAFENHAKAKVWEYEDLCYATDRFLEVIERTENSALGVNFDTANTLAFGDNPIPVLEKVLGRVVSIHAADTATRGKLRHVLIGTGLVPFREIFRSLKSAGFAGWICIEEAAFLGKEGVRHSLEYVKRTWNEA